MQQLAELNRVGRGGSMFGPSNDDFVEDEPSVRRRRSDM